MDSFQVGGGIRLPKLEDLDFHDFTVYLTESLFCIHCCREYSNMSGPETLFIVFSRTTAKYMCNLPYGVFYSLQQMDQASNVLALLSFMPKVSKDYIAQCHAQRREGWPESTASQFDRNELLIKVGRSLEQQAEHHYRYQQMVTYKNLPSAP